MYHFVKNVCYYTSNYVKYNVLEVTKTTERKMTLNPRPPVSKFYEEKKTYHNRTCNNNAWNRIKSSQWQ